MRWIVIFEDSPEMLEIRARKDLRDAHVTYVKAHPELLIGGGLKSSPEAPYCGAVWVVELETKAQVEQLIADDPFYFREFRSYRILTWGKILEDQSVIL